MVGSGTQTTFSDIFRPCRFLPSVFFHLLRGHESAYKSKHHLEFLSISQAYLDVNGKVRLYQPDLNMRRPERSAQRLMIPVSRPHISSTIGMTNFALAIQWR